MGKARACVSLLSEGMKCPNATVLGGKGQSLAEMARLGAPVPPAFTIQTGVHRAVCESGDPPKRLAWHIERGIRALERQTGKRFGDESNPLLVSVRSGAAVSMPGMMDTILNLGLNPKTVEGLAKQTGSGRFAYDCYRRFLAMFGEVVLNVEREVFESLYVKAKEMAGDRKLNTVQLRFLCAQYRDAIRVECGIDIPDGAWKQLDWAVTAVHESWNGERARTYRKAHKIPDWWGTAVNVQAMVFGNLGENSCSGVVFSRNVATGEPGLYGEFLVQSQGEDVVAGTITPSPIAQMRTWNQEIYAELENIVRQMEDHYNDAVDVEFTVERGGLYILQCRVAKRTPEAALTIATHFVWEKRWTKKEALEKVSAEQSHLACGNEFDPVEWRDALDRRMLGSGLPASPGVACGRAVYYSEDAVDWSKKGEQVVLIRSDTSPDDLPGMMAAVAVVTMNGGATCHAAVVARGMGKPAVVGCKYLTKVSRGEWISVNGTTGEVVGGKVKCGEKVGKKEVNIFLRWLTAERPLSQWPKPRLNFELIEQRADVNRLLNDFYLTSAMVQASVGTALADEAKMLERKTHVEVAEVIATYLALAVAAELRHTPTGGWASAEAIAAFNTLQAEFGVILEPSDTNDGRALAQRSVLAVLPKKSIVEQAEFFALAVTVFSDGAWGCHFGGKKWADIAQAGQMFLDGTFSHSVFVDHAFDLRHNSGRLFDKHPMVLANEGLVSRQLDIKKRVTNVEALWYQLNNWYALKTLEVSELLFAGSELGLWEEGGNK